MASGPRAARDGGVTAADVARALGVSRSTVSRAFSRDALVAPETRERVMRAAAELGYAPNALARSLISRRSDIVGVVLGDLSNPFHAQLLESLTATLQARALIPVTMKLPADGDIGALVPMLSQYNVSTVIITSIVVSQEMVETCRASGLAVILLNRVVVGAPALSICADHKQGAALAATHLAQTGRRRIAIVGGLANTWTNAARVAGFVDGVRANGLEPVAIVDGDYTYESGRHAARMLFGDRAPRPDAVLCANDPTGFGLLDAMRREFGLVAPDDVAVTGFDGVALAAWDAFDLTTVALPLDRMVEAVCDVCAEAARGGDVAAGATLLPCELVVRGSTSTSSSATLGRLRSAQPARRE